ncbi:hypothetical protein [Gracilibacillus oryzae]|uniref:hypothetical protein n=1 Tax=Gracilibacillus oryzae TaxID=1672701 RepID=UPI0018862E87|nr:hypothetical protein [Gracilibacillus oryzae]
MKKKWLSLLLAAIFSAGILTACGGESDNTEDPANEEQQTNEEQTTEDPAAE